MISSALLPDLPGAACKNTPDPEVFFPTSTGGRPSKWDDILMAETIEMCGHCPVRLKCLQWALEHDEQGIWGGTTDEQRRAMQGKPLTQEQRRRMVRQMHKQGMTDRKIAERLGCDRREVYNDRRVLKLPAQPDPFLEAASERRPKVAEMIARGMNDYEIAAVVGVSRDTIYRDRRAMGLGPNGKRASA